MKVQPPEDVQNQIDKINTLRRADPNILSRDLSFEISCWDALGNGVPAKYDNYVCQLGYTDGNGLSLLLNDVSLVQNYPCDSVSLDRELFVEKWGCSCAQWIVDDSILKSFSGPPFQSDVLINHCHVSQYDPGYESALRAVLQFKGKTSPIQFYNHFYQGDEKEIGVRVDSYGSLSCVINGIRFLYRGKNYLLHSYVDNSHEANYIVIDAQDPVTWNVFTEVSRHILYVVGFLTGHFMFGPFLVFIPKDGERSELVGYEDCLPPRCESLYQMTGMNPYSYFAASDITHATPAAVGDKVSPIEKLRPKLKPFKRQHVEELMKLLDDKDFSYLFHTLVENSMSQHLRMATSRLIAYATCLEIGGNWVRKRTASGNNGTNTEFLPAKIKEDLTRRLQTDVDDYVKSLEALERTGGEGCISETPHKDAKEILLEKLRIVKLRVGSELFKQTNAEKLSAQFLKNGITLTDSEVKLLDRRNKILHGVDAIEVPFELDAPEQYIDASEGKCFEYYALIWRLIMHVIRYDGVYRDVAGIQSSFRTHRSNNGAPFIRNV